MTRPRPLPRVLTRLSWWLAVACVVATATALLLGERARADEPEAPRASSGEPSDRSAHGLAPLPGDAMVPLAWMPPGTNASPVPSDEIFPPQELTIRFNHRLHVEDHGQSCRVCHGAAYGSTATEDRLLPDPVATCDHCHDVDHRDLDAVRAGGAEDGQCRYCHLGEDAGRDGRVARLVIPPANLRMNHKAHLDRNIDCAQCHGRVDKLELATRDQLPRMAGCFRCHAMSGAAAGEAKSACTNCHLRDPSGALKVTFSTGSLLPPMWLHGAAHTPDWIERHKGVAGAHSDLCAACHESSYCTDCHDGRVRPRNVHPNDWISMHAQGARQDNPRCVSCHQLQSFCGDCHRRVGVARDGPSDRRAGARRFHPPPAAWTTAPRGPQHHAWEAQRNLNACVSCHSERDCATCHASKGVRGGGGVNPHPPGFTTSCRLPFSRNPRPCLVCHTSGDRSLASCR